MSEEKYWSTRSFPVNVVVKNIEVAKIDYLIHYSKGMDPQPLVLFLHGAHARGCNVMEVTTQSLPKMLMSDGNLAAQVRGVVMCPQCPPHIEWKDSSMCSALMSCIDQIIEESNCRIDPRKIYVTGISMGGLGTWMMAARYPNRFAAAVPICGGGKPVFAPLLKHMPIWFFHSADDNVVSVEDTDKLFHSLISIGSTEAKYTRYITSNDAAVAPWMVGHNCWDKAYSSAELWEWLFAQQLR